MLTGTLADAGRRTTQCVQDWCRAHLGEIEPAAQPSLDWVSGVRLGDGAPVLLPADLCLRRLPHTQTLLPRSALSTGCAAGVSRETAMLRAVLELIERDAASLWWMGGRCPRPIALEEPAAQSGAALLSVLRAGRSARRSWLADVTTEFAVPCVAALSVDNDSRGLACGLAARMTLEEAVRAAILEMCQSELELNRRIEAENGKNVLAVDGRLHPEDDAASAAGAHDAAGQPELDDRPVVGLQPVPRHDWRVPASRSMGSI